MMRPGSGRVLPGTITAGKTNPITTGAMRALKHRAIWNMFFRDMPGLVMMARLIHGPWNQKAAIFPGMKIMISVTINPIMYSGPPPISGVAIGKGMISGWLIIPYTIRNQEKKYGYGVFHGTV